MQNSQTLNTLIEQYADEKILQAMKNLLVAKDEKVLIEGATEISDLFGDIKAFKSLFDESSPKNENDLIISFHNNTRLLVQKTWIEKADETIKDRVLLQLDTVCEELKSKNYTEIYRDCISCLENIVYLMFGKQAHSEAFSEYALRIDPAFGVFWLFLKKIAEKKPETNYGCKIYLLLAIVFLANY